MLQGPLNAGHNQRMIAIAICIAIGIMLALGVIDWTYSVWGLLSVGGLAGIGLLYVGVALYRNWF